MEAFKILDKYYPEKIEFLSLDTPFRFLISVVLSAQTTDNAVLKVTPVLFEKYPDERALAKAKQGDVEEIIHSLGFYHTKAKNIIALTQRVCEIGYIPEDIDDLIKLPGVGRKTANCYINTVLSSPAVIVDTHFKRVAFRLGYTKSSDSDRIEDDIKDSFDQEYWSRLSMVLNLHGRRICSSQNPKCDICPVNSYCTIK